MVWSGDPKDFVKARLLTNRRTWLGHADDRDRYDFCIQFPGRIVEVEPGECLTCAMIAAAQEEDK